MKTFTSFYRLLPACAFFALAQSCSSGGSSSGDNSSSGTSSSSSSSSSSSGTGNTYTKHDLVLDLAEQLTTAYENFDSQAIVLRDQANTFCSDTSKEEEFLALQNSWHSAMLAWQYIQGVNFGPITITNRIDLRISFYPVSQNQMQQRIHDLIDGAEPITTSVIEAGAGSLQGLPALEYILFRENALITINDGALRHCEYITSVSDNIGNLSELLTTAWASGGGSFSAFVASENAQESLADWVEAINLHVTIVQQKLASGNVSDIESPFAQTSMLSVKENIQFLYDAFFMDEASGIDLLLNQLDASTAAADLGNRLTIALASLNAVDRSIVLLNSTDAGKLELDRLVDEVHNVQEDLAIEVADALGVSIIFNGADGD